MKRLKNWLSEIFSALHTDDPVAWCPDCDGDIDPDPDCPTCWGRGVIGVIGGRQHNTLNNTWRGR